MRGQVKVGEKYNFLTVIGEPYLKSKKNGSRQSYVICRCDCGNEREVQCMRLRNGGIKGCGFDCPCHTEKYLADLTPEKSEWQAFPGERYSRLLVIGEPFFMVFKNAKQFYKMQYVLCRCDCGKEVEVKCKFLRDGTTKSCSCLQRDIVVSKMKGSRAKDGEKKCCRCERILPVNDFKLSKYAKDGYKSACSRCEKNAALTANYGITIDEYEKILEDQNNACAICGSLDPKTPSGSKRQRESKFFCIDHHHDTGHVRGLLCFNCNTGLGQFGDSEETLLKAASYLKTKITRSIVTNSETQEGKRE